MFTSVELSIVFVLIILALVCILSLGCTFLVNYLLGFRLSSRLISSAVVSTLVYAVTSLVLLIGLKPLSWVNGEPQNWQTMIREYTALIALLPAIAAILLWRKSMHRLSPPEESGNNL